MRQVECHLGNWVQNEIVHERTTSSVTESFLWIAKKKKTILIPQSLVSQWASWKISPLRFGLLTVHEKLRWLSWTTDAGLSLHQPWARTGSLAFWASLSCWVGGGCFLSAEGHFFYLKCMLQISSSCWDSVVWCCKVGCAQVSFLAKLLFTRLAHTVFASFFLSLFILHRVFLVL